VASCWIFYMNYTMMHGSTNIKYGIELYVMRPKQLDQSVSQKRDAKNADSKKLHFATSYPLFIYGPITSLSITPTILPQFWEWLMNGELKCIWKKAGVACFTHYTDIRLGTEENDEDRQWWEQWTRHLLNASQKLCHLNQFSGHPYFVLRYLIHFIYRQRNFINL